MKRTTIALLITVIQLSLTNLMAQEQIITNFPEMACLHTDRNIFIAGENLFFKLYILNGSNSTPSNKSNFAYLILRNIQNSAIYTIRIKLSNSIAYGSLYLPDTLSTGPYQLISYTNCMRNAGEECFFTREIFIANRFDNDLSRLSRQSVNAPLPLAQNQKAVIHNLKISSDRPQYHKRGKIGIDIESSDSALKLPINISISVHKTEPFGNSPISSNLKISKAKSSVCSYLPENKGIIMNGRLIAIDNLKDIADKTIFLSSPDSIANLQICKTDKEGKFQFLLNDYYSDKTLYFKAPDTKDAKIEIDNKFHIKNTFQPSYQYMTPQLTDYLIQCQNIVSIQKNYRIDSKKELPFKSTSTTSAPTIYHKPHFTTYPADYVKLNDFIEISRELLTLSKIRKHSNKYYFNMLDFNHKNFFSESPLIFLDGVPIDDISQIINLGTDKINKIETIGESRYYGDLLFYGIISVFSKNHEINSIKWTTPSLSIKQEQDYPCSVFNSPEHPLPDKKDKYTPDFRQLLYWQPNIILQPYEKKHIEFYASDNQGEYTIDIKGFSNDGTPINAQTSFKISSVNN